MIRRYTMLAILAFSLMPMFVHAGRPGEVMVGESLRNAPLHTFNGGTRQLKELFGKPLLINVWASWCGPCRAEMGSLERLSRRKDSHRFTVIGISTDDDPNAAYAFIKQSKVTFENFIDRNLVLENMLGANRIPLTVLVDVNGRVLAKIRGSKKWDSTKWIDYLGLTFSN